MKRLVAKTAALAALLISSSAYGVLMSPVYHDSIDLYPHGNTYTNRASVFWDNVVYISGWGNCVDPLYAVDVSDPDNLRFIAAVGGADSCYYNQIMPYEDKLYVAAWYKMLKVFDVPQPGTVTQIGVYDRTPGPYYGWGVDVFENRAYLLEASETTNGFYIIDISNPASPTMISTIDDTYLGWGGLAVRGSYAFAGMNHYGSVPSLNDFRFVVVNISDENNPYIVKQISGLPGGVGWIRLRGDIAYVGSDGVIAYDISDPVNPVEIGRYSGISGEPKLLDNYIFMGAGGNGIGVLNISNPANMTLSQHYGIPTTVNLYESTLSGNGRYIYVGTMMDPGAIPEGTDPEVKLHAIETLTVDPDDEGPGEWKGFSAQTSHDLQYHGDALPSAASPAWPVTEGSESWASVQPDGTLRINDTGTVSGDKIKWRRAWNATNSRGATVVTRVRVASNSAVSSIPNIFIEDGKYSEEFSLLSDRIKANGSGLQHFLDGTQWHVYRITTQGSQYKVYVDEAPTPVFTGTFTATTNRARVTFGSGSSPAIQDIYYDYFYCFSNGAEAPAGALADTTPDLSAMVKDIAGKGSLSGIDPSTANVQWSTNGGATWQCGGWDCKYEADALPTVSSPAWSIYDGSQSYASVASGVLRVNDNSTASGSKIRWSRDWRVSPAIGTTVLARVRCASTGGSATFMGNIYVEDGARQEIFKVFTDRIVAANAAQTYFLDATQWHTYRITTKGTSFALYVDENTAPVMTGSLNTSVSTNRIMFGSGSSDATQDIYFDYVYYTGAGAFAPGAPAVTVNCTGEPGTDRAIVNALAVPFNQYSQTLNQVRFSLLDMVGNRSFSPVYTVRIADPGSTPPVSSFTATTGDTFVTLNWTNPANPQFTGTMIRFKTNGYPTGPTDGMLVINKSNTPGSSDSHQHNGLTNGVTYFYSAYPHDAAPNYWAGATASSIPWDPVPPGPVTGLTATAGRCRITLNWTNPGAADFAGTTIRYRTDGYPTSPLDGSLAVELGSSATSYIHKDLNSACTYYYSVFARDEVPNYSAIAQASATPEPLPSAPEVTLPANGSYVTSFTPTITWTGDTHDQYRVRISQANDPNTCINGWDSGALGSSDNSCVSGSLRPMTQYYVFVQIHNAAGWSDWSASGRWFVCRTGSDQGVFYPANAVPSASGWTFYDSGVESGPGLTSAILADGGSNVFQINDFSTTRLCKERYAVTDVSFDTGASIALRMKATGTISGAGPNAGISNGGVGGVFISVTTSNVRLVDKNGTTLATHTLDGTVYHKYHLTVKNATAGNNATAVWNLYVDGYLATSWTGAGTDDGFDGFMIGAGPVTATGTWWIDWAAGRADGDFAPTAWDPTDATVFPVSLPDAPVVTMPVNGSYTTSLTPNISWAGDAHDQYQVRISQLNDPNTSLNGWDSGAVNDFANGCMTGTLKNLTLYYVFVRIHNAAGWSDWSAGGRCFITRGGGNTGIFYPADALPSSSGWSLYDSGIESGPGLSSAILADGGSNVFRITDTSTGRHCKERYVVTDVDFDTGASAIVRMKATGTITGPGPNAGISNTGVGGMYIAVTTTEVRLVEKTGTVRGSYSLDGAVYHKYHLTAKNATPGNNSTALWKVYVDGVERISWTGAGADDGFDGFMLGASPLTATGTWWIDWAAGRSDGAYSPTQWAPIDPDPNVLEAPSVTDDGLYTGSLSKLHCSWSSVTGATQYRYCIGTAAGGAEVISWSNVGPVLEVENASLSLSEGQTYYFSVQAGDGTNWSESGVSNGILVPTGVSIQAAKALADTQVRAIRGMTVTAAFTGYFYIQDPLLPYGMKVVSSAAVSPGDTADVAGPMAGAGGERYIDASAGKVETSTGIPIAPTAFSNLALGGADLNALALGVTGGVGANNLGLLVTCWGTVYNIVGTTYTISDGSQVAVTVQAPNLASVPADGSFTVVTGISSMDANRQRVILVPSAEQ